MISYMGSVLGRHFVFRITQPESTTDILGFMSAAWKEVIPLLSGILRTTRTQFKVAFNLHCTYQHAVHGELMDFSHDTKVYTLLTEDDVLNAYRRGTELVLQSETEYETVKSQWRLLSCDSLDINLYRWSPLSGGAGNCTIKKVLESKSLVNISNSGNECFKFAVSAKFVKKRPSEKFSYYKDPDFETRFKWLPFPMKIEDIAEFERVNNQPINVFSLDPVSATIYPMRVTCMPKGEAIDLFFYDSHFMFISKFDSFLTFMENKKRRGYYCKHCLIRFSTDKKRLLHSNICSGDPRGPCNAPPLPKMITDKAAVTEIHCRPELSFMTCILSDQEEDYCDWTDFINANLTISDIKSFERKHPAFDIAVYSHNEVGKIYPLKVSESPDPAKIQKDLLLVRDNLGTRFHVIHDLSRLLRQQTTRHKTKHHYCRRCFSKYDREEALAEHITLCKDNPVGKAIVPFGDAALMRFQKFKNKQRIGVVMYLDFEAILSPIEEKVGTSTTRYQRHDVSAFCLYTVSMYKEAKDPIVYRGADAAKVCLEHIEEAIKETALVYNTMEPLKVTKEQRKKLLDSAKICHICERPMYDPTDRVIDHDHVTGKIRGVAHNSCNLCYILPSFVPVFVHNLNYDLKFLVQAMASKSGSIKVIPTTEEKYVSLMRQSDGLQYRFIDTYRFLSSSLADLVMIQTPDTFKHTAKHFPPHLLSLLRRKGVYPYDYMDSWQKYEETSLPRIEEFHSKLNNQPLSEEDYKHAQTVWTSFNVKDMGEFTDIYVKADCLMLADIFEKFRDTIMTEYKLDPAWYFTLPGFGLDAFLYSTRVTIQLLQDINMIYMFQKGVRGGFSCVSHRYCAPINEYLGNMPENGKESSQMILLDANALYATALSEYLPKDSFRWMTKQEIEQLDVLKTRNDDNWGYLLEVDLLYPPHLHEEHKDLPFCPEMVIPENSHEPKLLTTLWDKKNYVIHIRALRQAVEHGLVLKKIHRGIIFRQEPFIRPFIEKTTKLRQGATSSFEKDLWKLLGNSLYGKMLESVQKRLDVEIVTNPRRFDKVVQDNFFKKATIFGRDISAMHRTKKYIKYDRPQFVGQACLDIAKAHIYWFWYDVLKAKYKDDITLCMTDTDSLGFELRNHDFYKDMREMLHFFDTSDYPKDHACFSLKNKKALGLFKEEYNSKPIRRFIGLRAKMYVIETDEEEKKRAKGIKRSVVSNEITANDYLDCLQYNKDFTHEQSTISSKKLVLYTVKMKKKSLSSHDDKRYVMRDGISTLPYGHCDLEKHRTFLRRVHEELRSKVLCFSPYGSQKRKLKKQLPDELPSHKRIKPVG